jgi:hypothetical protein
MILIDEDIRLDGGLLAAGLENPVRTRLHTHQSLGRSVEGIGVLRLADVHFVNVWLRSG